MILEFLWNVDGFCVFLLRFSNDFVGFSRRAMTKEGEENDLAMTATSSSSENTLNFRVFMKFSKKIQRFSLN
jgi:hypothetical protein